MPHIYVAGPLFNTHERWYLEQIAAALEAAGYTTFVPHRDAGLVDFTVPDAQSRIFRDDIVALDACDLCVALLTGADQDSGTSAELGYMFAHGKPCFGITDDFRYLNNMIWGICGEGKRIAKDIPGLIALLAQQEVNTAPQVQNVPPQSHVTAQLEAIIQRRNDEFASMNMVQPATWETIRWTLDEMLEEAEDSDYATKSSDQIITLQIIRDILVSLTPASPSENEPST